MPTVTTESVRDELVSAINSAAASLAKAYQVGVQANPLAADVPAIRKINQMSKELNQLMQDVSKLRF